MSPFFQNVYDAIALDYHAKRSKPWKYFLKFLEDIEKQNDVEKGSIHGIYCDLGCGTGRHSYIISNQADIYLGLDLSFEMINLARKTQFDLNIDGNNINIVKQQWIACDIEHIPLRNSSLSSIISIAVLHHILSHRKREMLLSNLHETLKDNGNMILSLWGSSVGEKAKSTKKRDYFLCMTGKKQFCILPNRKKSIKKILGLKRNDVYIPWRISMRDSGKIEVPRVYHLFTYSELQEFKKFFEIIAKKIYPDIHSAENKETIERSGINYFVLLKKI